MVDLQPLTQFNTIYPKWLSLQKPDEPFNDRFACARVTISTEVTIDELIHRHIALCSKIDPKVVQHLQDRVLRPGKGFGAIYFEDRWEHSALAPTAKSVFLLADRLGDEVIVVLTGETDGLHIDAQRISFDGWEARIIERLQPHVARMRLEDAVEFTHGLDEDEQSSNIRLQRLNNLRLEAIKENLHKDVESRIAEAWNNGMRGYCPDVEFALERVRATTSNDAKRNAA